MRKVLFDTNICIYREDHKILDERLQTMLKLLNAFGSMIVIHPLSIRELKSDWNKDRGK